MEFQYSEDYEGIGRHNEAGAIVTGDPTRVRARAAGMRAELRLSGHIRPQGRGRFWIADDRAFVKALRLDLEADGFATVIVRAVGAGGPVRKSCALDYEPDPEFGDFAGCKCRRLG